MESGENYRPYDQRAERIKKSEITFLNEMITSLKLIISIYEEGTNPTNEDQKRLEQHIKELAEYENQLKRLGE